MIEWYKKTTWTKKDEENFFLKLRKAKQKDSYLATQAKILLSQKDKKLQDAGLALAKKVIDEYADYFHIRSVFIDVAEFYASRKNFEEAIKYYIEAVEDEIKRPYKIDYSYVKFGKFVVDNKIKKAYDDVIKYLLHFRKADPHFENRPLPNYETSKILAEIYKRKKNKEKAIYFKQLVSKAREQLDKISNEYTAKLDSAYWHYEADNFPKCLKMRSAATHIGMFVKWCVLNNYFKAEKSETEKILAGMITGAQFLLSYFDGKFHVDDLIDECADFARNYYDESKFTKKFNSYLKDYDSLFSDQYETIYHIEDSNKNYEMVKAMIDARFEEWKKFKL